MRRYFVVLAITMGLLATPALGSVDEIQVHVQGLACPFCVFGIEKSLKKVPGVVSVETTIRTGVVRMQVKPGTPVDTDELNEAVAKSGFTLGHIEATVTGRLVSRDERPALEADPGGQILLLIEAGEQDVFKVLSGQTLEKLKRASEDGSRPLTISGRVHGHVGTLPALAVETFKVAQ